MAKLAWNKFAQIHGQRYLGAPILLYFNPATAELAKDVRKMPSSLQLINAVLSKSLSGDWTSRKLGKGMEVLVATLADLKKIWELFLLDTRQLDPNIPLTFI